MHMQWIKENLAQTKMKDNYEKENIEPFNKSMGPPLANHET